MRALYRALLCHFPIFSHHSLLMNRLCSQNERERRLGTVRSGKVAGAEGVEMKGMRSAIRSNGHDFDCRKGIQLVHRFRLAMQR